MQGDPSPYTPAPIPKELTPEDETKLARKLLDFSSALERLMKQHNVNTALAIQAMAMLDTRRFNN